MFLALAIPGAFSLFLEWGSYEVMAGMAGHLGPVALATHGVFMNTASLFYNAPLAIADATSVLVGNSLGNNCPADAKQMMCIGVTIDMVWGMFTSVLLLGVLRPYWGFWFTNDRQVQFMVYEDLPVMAVYVIVDSMKCITCNVLRSTGRPQITTLFNLIVCLFIMIPLGYVLGLVYYFELYGLWGAMCVGWMTAAVIYLYILMQTDWIVLANEACNRNLICKV